LEGCDSSFRDSRENATHKRAVESIITIPQTTRDVGELLSSAHAAEKRTSLSCYHRRKRFLTRQGIALRGDGDEDNSNFMQLLYLRSTATAHLAEVQNL